MSHMNNPIQVHPLTDNPTAAWGELSKNISVIEIDTAYPPYPIRPDYVRFVCMSDTHLMNIPFPIPSGDVFLHAGDFTQLGQETELQHFNDWIGALPHKHKIVISGNHELSFDKTCDIFETYKVEGNARHLLTKCTYIEDEMVELYGIKIYGAPWQPYHRGWAFNLKRGQNCLDKWNLIPEDTDILMTHTPPLGFGDVTSDGGRAGCVELLTTIQQRVKPKYHISGHLHGGYGWRTDGTTHFINAATCNDFYKAVNLPIVFDYLLPTGFSKN